MFVVIWNSVKIKVKIIINSIMKDKLKKTGSIIKQFLNTRQVTYQLYVYYFRYESYRFQ